MPRLECFFDCSSPWTYLCFESLQPIAARYAVSIEWRPILVGGVFNSVNPGVYAQREQPVPAKARYARKDLQDWARLFGIEIGEPPVFPVNSVKVMRGALLAIERDRLVPYARAAFRAYWGALQDISQDTVIRAVAAESGLDGDEVLAFAASDAARAQLRTNTEELIARGGFGSPTLFVDEADLYFGNDRLVLVDAALQRALSGTAGTAGTAAGVRA